MCVFVFVCVFLLKKIKKKKREKKKRRGGILKFMFFSFQGIPEYIFCLFVYSYLLKGPFPLELFKTGAFSPQLRLT